METGWTGYGFAVARLWIVFTLWIAVTLMHSLAPVVSASLCIVVCTAFRSCPVHILVCPNIN